MSDAQESHPQQRQRPSENQRHCDATTPTATSTTLRTDSTITSPSAESSLAAAGSVNPESGTNKPWPPRICGVCGDRAKSYHFGGISCDSCKAFFRRSVQNESHFQCPNRGNCRITLASRKSCQACRFAKCLAIGMEASWVMTEQERRARMQQRLIAKGDSGGRPAPPPRPPETPPSAEDVGLLEELVHAYVAGCAGAPFAAHLQREEKSRTELLDVFFTLVHQISGFAQGLQAFARVRESDRHILLRTAVLELCFLRSAMNFDDEDDRWPSRVHFGDEATSVPCVRASDVERLVPVELWALHRKFLVSTRRLKPDPLTLLLLSAIALLCPDRAGIRDLETLALQQERYCALLRRYVTWRKVAPIEFAKVLMRLPDLRELADTHADSDLLFDAKEAADVQRHLSNVMRHQGGSFRETCSRSAPPNQPEKIRPRRNRPRSRLVRDRQTGRCQEPAKADAPGTEVRLHELTESSLPRSCLQAGFVYPFNVDRYGNHVLLLRPANIRSLPMADVRRVLVFFVETLLRRQNASRITLLVDCVGGDRHQLDLGRYLMALFRCYYPRSLGFVLLWQPPRLLQGIWRLCKGLMPVEALERVRFVTASDISHYVDRDKLPVRMGGTDNYHYEYVPGRPLGERCPKLAPLNPVTCPTASLHVYGMFTA
ncbi:vitamin D3 receptor isoform X2 [Rhipicephalus microplus]|uniref:vitamin D3 receptor isoform X2 n=1 Tax=Rhipicephalus microplus TaxID=6941 RepID=UPI003F6A8D32